MAISFFIHSTILVVACWPALDGKKIHGARTDDSGNDLVVQFVSLPRSASDSSAAPMPPQKEKIEAALQQIEVERHNFSPDETPPLTDSFTTNSISGDGMENLPETENTSNLPTGSSITGDDIESRYIEALKETIYGKWKASSDSKSGSCDLTIQQTTGGSVLSAKLDNCDLPPAEQRALEAATLMAQPLPYIGFESVFLESRTITIDRQR